MRTRIRLRKAASDWDGQQRANREGHRHEERSLDSLQLRAMANGTRLSQALRGQERPFRGRDTAGQTATSSYIRDSAFFAIALSMSTAVGLFGMVTRRM